MSIEDIDAVLKSHSSLAKLSKNGKNKVLCLLSGNVMSYNLNEINSFISGKKYKSLRKVVSGRVIQERRKLLDVSGSIDKSVFSTHGLSKKNKNKSKKKESSNSHGKDEISEMEEGSGDVEKIETAVEQSRLFEEAESCNRMSQWKDFGIPGPLLAALKEMDFDEPTPIQRECIPAALLYRRDVLGCAETGSGKTLAFGLPILAGIMRLKERTDDEKGEDVDEENVSVESDESIENDMDDNQEIGEDGPVEFRGQTVVNLISKDSLTNFVNADGDFVSSKESMVAPKGSLIALIIAPTRELVVQVRNHLVKAAKYLPVKIVPVFGGMSLQKQERLLSRKPEIVVATPGRFWELVQSGNVYVKNLSSVRYLAVDEADRMKEKGHFREFQSILDLLNSYESASKRQTFIFSATLASVDLPGTKSSNEPKENKVDNLIEYIGVRPSYKLVDLVGGGKMASRLIETRIMCGDEEKDLYLYSILRLYPGRTLVFANAKSCVRRLGGLLSLLRFRPLLLHADMPQRRRLQNLERFTADSRGLLIATDVAARGLDIPKVDHVVHYQVPRTSENYLHRSGRTARSNLGGVSLMLVGSDDLIRYRKIVKALHDDDLPFFPVREDYYKNLRPIVSLAVKIDKLENGFMKRTKRDEWFRKMAKETEYELDETILQEMGGSEEKNSTRRQLADLKNSLNNLLAVPLISHSMGSGKYLTRTGSLPPDMTTYSSALSILSQKRESKPEPSLSRKKSRIKKRASQK